LIFDLLLLPSAGLLFGHKLIFSRLFSKYPPVETGDITGFKLRLPDFVGYFHPPVLLVVLKSEE